jgi:hypothetical protein
MRFAPQALTDVAVDEWMGSNPICNARNRKNLKIEGKGVSAVLKAFQVDIGAPHQFLDFRFELVDETLGYFWINTCDAISAGEQGAWLIKLSDADNPGFDALLEAVNPKARCRPTDPSKLASNGRRPVYAWEIIIIGDEAEPRDRSNNTEPSLVDQLRTFRHRQCRVE